MKKDTGGGGIKDTGPESGRKKSAGEWGEEIRREERGTHELRWMTREDRQTLFTFYCCFSEGRKKRGEREGEKRWEG